MANTRQIFIMLVVLVLLGTAGVVWSRNGSLNVFKEKDKDTSLVQATNSQPSVSESSSEDEQKKEDEKIRDDNDKGRNEREDIEDDDRDGDEDDDEGSASPTSQTTSGNPSASLGSYTAAQVAAHANQSSCWSIIDSNVYDLTAWISKHPGGEGAILGLCGKDGTSAFHDQHGTKTKQANILASMKIGALVK